MDDKLNKIKQVFGDQNFGAILVNALMVSVDHRLALQTLPYFLKIVESFKRNGKRINIHNVTVEDLEWLKENNPELFSKVTKYKTDVEQKTESIISSGNIVDTTKNTSLSKFKKSKTKSE